MVFNRFSDLSVMLYYLIDSRFERRFITQYFGNINTCTFESNYCKKIIEQYFVEWLNRYIKIQDNPLDNTSCKCSYIILTDNPYFSFNYISICDLNGC